VSRALLDPITENNFVANFSDSESATGVFASRRDSPQSLVNKHAQRSEFRIGLYLRHFFDVDTLLSGLLARRDEEVARLLRCLLLTRASQRAAQASTLP